MHQQLSTVEQTIVEKTAEVSQAQATCTLVVAQQAELEHLISRLYADVTEDILVYIVLT